MPTRAPALPARSRPGDGWAPRFDEFEIRDPDREAVLARLDRLSWLLDVAFRVPGTNIRFGVDGILGLIPGFGDLAGGVLSSIILVEAARLGVPKTLLARMAFNVALEVGIGSVPVAGDVFDVLWRANRRNMRLLRRHFDADGVR